MTADLSPADMILSQAIGQSAADAHQAPFIPHTTEPIWHLCECTTPRPEVPMRPSRINALGRDWRVWLGTCPVCQTRHWTAAPMD